MALPSAWRGDDLLVLASGSPTRLRLLQAAAIPCDVAVPTIDERRVEAELATDRQEEIATGLARAKALAVASTNADRVIVGADQVLIVDDRLLHKAASRAEAAERLNVLGGRTHRLISAFALVDRGEVVATGAEEATLTMRPLDEEAIERYLDLAGDAALGSVGCYAVEGVGIHLFERIEGEHTAILGLPMPPLLAALRRFDRLVLA